MRIAKASLRFRQGKVPSYSIGFCVDHRERLFERVRCVHGDLPLFIASSSAAWVLGVAVDPSVSTIHMIARAELELAGALVNTDTPVASEGSISGVN